MPFVRKTWADGQTVDAAEMNRIEAGIVDAAINVTGAVQFKASRSGTSTALAASAFRTYPLDTLDLNVGGGSYDTGTYIYTVPVAGIYLCLGGIRMSDSATARSVATGIGTENADAPFVMWDNMGSPAVRSGRQYTRIINFAVGDQVRLFIWSGATFNTHYAASSAGGPAGQFMSLTLLS